MWNVKSAACAMYGVLTLILAVDVRMFREQDPRPVPPSALERGRARGLLDDGVPRLAPDDAMANAAILGELVDDTPPPGETRKGRACEQPARSFAVQIEGRLSWVRFGARAVCQLAALKRTSVAQPGFGARGVGEVGAFVLGRRRAGGRDVEVTRVVVPPFRFTRDTLTFLPADLGRLGAGERLIGTYHTHPDGDLEQGALSEVDLRYMRDGHVDFHGHVGRMASGGDGLDWLFDIVDPRDGGWNVYAHDARRLAALLAVCESTRDCPLNDLRLAGSRYYLLTRSYDDPTGHPSEFWDGR